MGIELEHVSAGYGSPGGTTDVLKDLTFAIEEGHTVCILGENGSGKSTLLRVLAGILDYRGSIRTDEKELSKMSRQKVSQKMAFMTQFSEVYFSYTVWETVMLGRYLKMKKFLGRPTEKDCARVQECLEMTGLSDIKDKALDTLSGGQLQRVFLARAFAQDTPYILLDEPTNHLDLKYQAQLAGYLREWVGKETTYPEGRTQKNTVIGVFHDINLALQIADELLIMKDGKILAYGEKGQILQSDVLRQAYDMDIAAYMREQLRIWDGVNER